MSGCKLSSSSIVSDGAERDSARRTGTRPCEFRTSAASGYTASSFLITVRGTSGFAARAMFGVPLPFFPKPNARGAKRHTFATRCCTSTCSGVLPWASCVRAAARFFSSSSFTTSAEGRCTLTAWCSGRRPWLSTSDAASGWSRYRANTADSGSRAKSGTTAGSKFTRRPAEPGEFSAAATAEDNGELIEKDDASDAMAPWTHSTPVEAKAGCPTAANDVRRFPAGATKLGPHGVTTVRAPKAVPPPVVSGVPCYRRKAANWPWKRARSWTWVQIWPGARLPSVMHHHRFRFHFVGR